MASCALSSSLYNNEFRYYGCKLLYYHRQRVAHKTIRIQWTDSTFVSRLQRALDTLTQCSADTKSWFTTQIQIILAKIYDTQQKKIKGQFAQRKGHSDSAFRIVCPVCFTNAWFAVPNITFGEKSDSWYAAPATLLRLSTIFFDAPESIQQCGPIWSFIMPDGSSSPLNIFQNTLLKGSFRSEMYAAQDAAKRIINYYKKSRKPKCGTFVTARSKDRYIILLQCCLDVTGKSIRYIISASKYPPPSK